MSNLILKDFIWDSNYNLNGRLFNKVWGVSRKSVFEVFED